jgi:hypothetical protein
MDDLEIGELQSTRRRNEVKWRVFAGILMILAVALTGCGSSEPAAKTEVNEADALAEVRGGLDPANRLALGTLRLEGTENALTAAQAAELLPLWHLIEGGSLQSETERNAVVKQIEGKMDDAQLAAIDDMGLTFEDTRAWMEETGIEMPAGPAGSGGPAGPADSEGQAGPGGPGALQNMSEEERTKVREEFQNMSAEERATRRAGLPTEARGIERPEGAGTGQGVRPGGGSRQGNALLASLVELLTERAAA